MDPVVLPPTAAALRRIGHALDDPSELKGVFFHLANRVEAGEDIREELQRLAAKLASLDSRSAAAPCVAS